MDNQPSEIDWARLAAFVDGEGTILVNKHATKRELKAGIRKGHSMWLRLQIGNTDPKLPIWLRDTFGGVVIVQDSRRDLEKHRICYKWHVSCKRAAELLRGIYPYLILKKDQTETALAFQETLGGPGKRVTIEVAETRERLRQELYDLKRTKYPVPSRFTGKV